MSETGDSFAANAIFLLAETCEENQRVFMAASCAAKAMVAE